MSGSPDVGDVISQLLHDLADSERVLVDDGADTLRCIPVLLSEPLQHENALDIVDLDTCHADERCTLPRRDSLLQALDEEKRRLLVTERQTS